MAEESRNAGERDELRRRAEARLREQPVDEGARSAEEISGLIHELRVHQIELEMQNEELRRAEEELAAARDRYVDLYDFAPVGYFTVGAKGLIEGTNLTGAALLGAERRSLVGKLFSRFVVREDQDLFYHHRRQVLSARELQHCELRVRREDGGVFWGKLECLAQENEKGDIRAFRVVLSDISQWKQMEQELVRTQRLRAVGELSAGVSHNLNNILATILSPAQLLKRMTDDPELLREVEDILSAVLRARDLVHRLHLSVRSAEQDALQAVPVDEIVREAVQATRSRWKDEPGSRGIAIQVVTELKDVSPIRGTPYQLYDIVTNLLFNAVDAMPQGGTIVIGAQTVEDGVRLTCRDTGVGMDEETRSRVFEPFFTTRMDVGSGLGLSTVYGTVTRWGGRIDVESAPGQGTTFALLFPAWKEPETSKEEKAF